MNLEHLSSNWQLTNPGGNSTNSGGLVAPVPVQTRPDKAAVSTGVQAVGDGVVRLGYGGNRTTLQVKLLPYGAGGTGKTFNINVFGWTPTFSDPGTDAGPALATVWIPSLLGTYACTTGSATGLTGGDVNASQSFATTITSSFSPSTAVDWNLILSPGSNSIGMIVQQTFGAMFLEVRFNMGTATSANCLIGRC